MRPLLVVVLLSGCLGADVDRDPPPFDPDDGHVVVAQEFRFDPTDLNVSEGEAVTWVNRDAVDHWIMAEDSSFDSGRLPPEARFSMAFNETGTYAYRCTIHAGMVGSIQVS